jgi:peptidoglycan/LPS O-acetylase OafA/YrhL
MVHIQLTGYREKQVADDKLLSNVLSFTGFLLLAFGYLSFNKELGFPGKWALVPVLGSVLIITAGSKAWGNRIILSNKVAVWFGLISFPLYLWHLPLLFFTRTVLSKIFLGFEASSRITRLRVVIVSIILAWLTYELIEKPIRSNKPTKFFAGTLVLIIISIRFLGYSSMRANGYPKREVPESKTISMLKQVYEFNDMEKMYGSKSCF